MDTFCPYCDGALNDVATCEKCGAELSKEVACGLQGTLPHAGILAQDNIDNACFELIREFAPGANWDAEEIGIVREALIEVLTKFHGKKAYDLYPWILEPSEDSAEAEAQTA